MANLNLAGSVAAAQQSMSFTRSPASDVFVSADDGRSQRDATTMVTDGRGADTTCARGVYFGDFEEPTFGWWHPVEGLVPLAVVICAPFGLEDLSAYRSLKYLANELATTGLPTLRFDFVGCGDSAGENDDADQVPKWTHSVCAAMDLAKARSGASRVALVGVRLGALLAINAALGRGDVSALVAIAPPSSGRDFIRECRMLGAAAGVGLARSDGGIQAAGFVLSGPTCDSLSRLKVPKDGLPVVRAALIVDRDDMAPSPIGQGLALLGTRVVQESQPGFASMVASPHFATTPRVMMGRVVEWLSEQRLESISTLDAASSAASKPHAADHVVLARDGGFSVCEQPVEINSTPRLTGQLTELHSRAPGLTNATSTRRSALLILNTGSERRIGPNRMWVSFARARAASGDVVLRLDQLGVGESDSRPGANENDVYNPGVLGDIAAALQWLQRHRQVSECTVMGVCSGAYHGFQAALAALPVNRVVSINPLLFHWSPDIALQDTATHPGGQLQHIFNAKASLGDHRKWLRLLRGQVDVSGLARVLLARGVRKLRLHLRGVARLTGNAITNDLGADLISITGRGVTIHFVFSSADPGHTILKEEAGSVLKQLCSDHSITLSTIDDADHTFTAVAGRARLWRTLHAILDDKRPQDVGVG